MSATSKNAELLLTSLIVSSRGRNLACRCLSGLQRRSHHVIEDIEEDISFSTLSSFNNNSNSNSNNNNNNNNNKVSSQQCLPSAGTASSARRTNKGAALQSTTSTDQE